MDNSASVAGRAAMTAAAVYLLMPIIVAIQGEKQVPLPSEVRGLWWEGALQALVLAGVGISLLILIVGTGALLRQRLGPMSVVRQAVHTIGLVGATGWLFAGAASLAQFSTVTAAIADTGADAAAQRAALHVVSVVLTVGLELASLALSVWLTMFSIFGLRAGVVGRPLAVAGVGVAAVVAATALVMVPAGLLLLIPYLPCLGVRLMRGAPVRVAAGPQVSQA
jgi:hypothetical protein